MSKSKQLKVRLSESDHSRIKELSEMYGVTISEYVTKRCLKVELDPERIPEVVTRKKVVVKYSDVAQADPKLIAEVARIGNNLNQIARAINKGKSVNSLKLLIALQSTAEALRTLSEVNANAK